MTTKEQHQGDLKVTKWYYILIEVVVTRIYPHVAKWHRIMQSIFVISSVHFSRSVVCDYMWPHAARQLPCPSPTPVLCSNSCPSSRWRHPTIASSVFPFSSCLLSFPGSGSFSMSQYFASGDQSIGVSISESVLPTNIQDWFPFKTDWLDLLSVQRAFKSLLQHHSSKASILWCSAFFMIQLSYPYMTTGKIKALTRQTFVGKVMSLLFNKYAV